MKIEIFAMGLVVGCFLNYIINRISFNILADKNIENQRELICLIESKENFRSIKKSSKELIFSKLTRINMLVILITGLSFLTSYMRIGVNVILFKAIILDCILVIISIVDFKYKIIPDIMVIISIIAGILLLFTRDISFTSAALGMLVGGGFLLLLGILPKAMGGGDIKLMFSLGLFLGLNRTFTALFISFLLAAVASSLLLIFKIKGRKDYIPFGPFLAFGSFAAFHFFF